MSLKEIKARPLRRGARRIVFRIISFGRGQTTLDEPKSDSNPLCVTLAFCLHLEVAQVGISLAFLSGKRVSLVFSTGKPSWQSGGREFDPRQLHQ